MVCHSQELNKEKFIKEHSEANQSMEENNKPIEHVQLLTEPGTLCYTLYSEDHWLITVHSLSNILPWT